MIQQEEVYKIGRLGKAHGIKGEVSFQFDDDLFDRILVPFFIEEYRFRNDSLCLVKFCDINTQQRASELTGCTVFFPRKLADEDHDTMSLASLVGFSLINSADGKTIGRITSIDDQTANILFVLEDDTLIPANSDLVKDIKIAEKQIFMDIPEGLLDI